MGGGARTKGERSGGEERRGENEGEMAFHAQHRHKVQRSQAKIDESKD
jgi:hypothetical protein